MQLITTFHKKIRKQKDKMEINIGRKIKEVFDSKEMKLSDFAQQLGMVRQNVYRVFDRKDMDTELLRRISRILDHDFFQYFVSACSESKPEEKEEEPFHNEASSKQLSETLEKTRVELMMAQKEITYLKKIVALLEERSTPIITSNTPL
jgi:transcriptional regulator with XRE-family HTH domain